MLVLLFILFGAMAIGCALAVVAQRNPLYSAISLIGVFISLACLYVMLAAPFIAAVQVVVYAGAIMVLVVFVIMLLNVEEEARRRPRLRFLLPAGVALAAVLIAEVTFILVSVHESQVVPTSSASDVGLTRSIGAALDDTRSPRWNVRAARFSKARLTWEARWNHNSPGI
jgi:NADH-quinone oxidoreductase subunit J